MDTGDTPFDVGCNIFVFAASSSSSSEVLKYSSSAVSISGTPCHRCDPLILALTGVLSSSCPNKVPSISGLYACI